MMEILGITLSWLGPALVVTGLFIALFLTSERRGMAIFLVSAPLGLIAHWSGVTILIYISSL